MTGEPWYAAFTAWLRNRCASELRAAYGDDITDFPYELIQPAINDYRLLRTLARLAFTAGWRAAQTPQGEDQ